MVALRECRNSGDCRGLCLFAVFLALCSAGDHKATEYKGRRFINSQSGDGNDKLAFLSNNTKFLNAEEHPQGLGD